MYLYLYIYLDFLQIGEFGKECADKWNNMAAEDKQPFLEVAARDRERYRKEVSINN